MNVRALFVIVNLALVTIACAALGPVDRVAIADDEATILRCQEVGRACKLDGGTDCYNAYDACMQDGGLH